MTVTTMKRADGQAGTLYKSDPVLSIMLNGAGWIGFGLALLVAAVTAVEALHHVEGAGTVAVVGLAGAAIFSLGLKYVFNRTRSVVVDAAAITSLAFGRPWRTLAWSQVRSIERVRAYNSTIESTGYSVHVAGDSVDIWMEDASIKDFDALLVELTKRAQAHQIELSARDRGRDTLAKIRAEVADPQERKRLLKRGIVTKLDSLVLQPGEARR